MLSKWHICAVMPGPFSSSLANRSRNSLPIPSFISFFGFLRWILVSKMLVRAAYSQHQKPLLGLQPLILWKQILRPAGSPSAIIKLMLFVLQYIIGIHTMPMTFSFQLSSDHIPFGWRSHHTRFGLPTKWMLDGSFFYIFLERLLFQLRYSRYSVLKYNWN